MLSDRCPVCLSVSICLFACPVLSCTFVTLVCCGQTAGCIKISLGKEVELGPGHIVLGGTYDTISITNAIIGLYFMF